MALTNQNSSWISFATFANFGPIVVVSRNLTKIIIVDDCKRVDTKLDITTRIDILDANPKKATICLKKKCSQERFVESQLDNIQRRWWMEFSGTSNTPDKIRSARKLTDFSSRQKTKSNCVNHHLLAN